MRISKQFRIAAALLIGGIVVASSACSVEPLEQSTAPTGLSSSVAPSLARGSGTTAASPNSGPGSLADGTYSFTIDPTKDQVVGLGRTSVFLPANSICALGVSGYGPTLWENGCNPQKKTFALKVTVAGSATDTPGYDFQPAMRFDPTKTVTMFFWVKNLNQFSPSDWFIFYCATPDGKPGERLGTSLMQADPSCVDESKTDSSLVPRADATNSQLVRRVKHFSAYQISLSGYVGSE